MLRARRLLDAVTHRLGIHVSRYQGWGEDADADLARLLGPLTEPTVFDVGANRGQSVLRFKTLLPNCHLHAFEPSPESFRELQARTASLDNLTLVPAGVGSSDGRSRLLENSHSDMTSFLRPGAGAWGNVVRESDVPLVSLDNYCRRHHIDRIDLLKIDTQGYDMEVLRGAQALLASESIRVIKVEVIFGDLYEDAPRFDEIYRFMVDNGFRLLAFYDLYVVDRAASWADAIFLR